jgi:hypothetical protein
MSDIDQATFNIDLIFSKPEAYATGGPPPYGWTPSATGIMGKAVSDLRAGGMSDPDILSLLRAKAAQYAIVDASLATLLTLSGIHLNLPAPVIHDSEATSLSIPIIGPFIDSISASTGLSPTIVLIGGGLGLAWMLGLFDGGRR